MRILFVGDVMGNVGQTAVTTYLPKLKRRYKPQVTIVNGENATRGRGINQEVYKDILTAGADVITMGNHTWDNNEIFDFINGAKKLIRPLNFPPATTPGVGYTIVKVNTVKLAVINLQGNVFMGQNLAILLRLSNHWSSNCGKRHLTSSSTFTLKRQVKRKPWRGIWMVR